MKNKQYFTILIIEEHDRSNNAALGHCTKKRMEKSSLFHNR